MTLEEIKAAHEAGNVSGVTALILDTIEKDRVSKKPDPYLLHACIAAATYSVVRAGHAIYCEINELKKRTTGAE